MKLKSKTTMVLACAIIGIVLLGGLTTTAGAALITYDFSGTVSSVDPALAPTFSVGQTLTGSYTFDSTTAARAGSNSEFAVFDALTSLNFSIGSYSASSSGAQEIQVDSFANGAPDDRYAVVSRATGGLVGAAVNGNPLNFFSFRLDAPGGLFSTALTLPTNVTLGDFTSSQFFVFFGPITSPLVISGTMTEVAPVPEPSTMLLIGSGLAGLAAFRKKFGAA